MQDIVFYAAAHETLGIVRDSVNAKKKPAPVLALGVSVRLRMRLFAGLNVATPYPIASFNDITDWQWNMDGDFDRSTACKLVADSGGISVHTVSDTVEGKTMNFTEFVIPISNMNTEELAAWLGNQQKRSGLTGELVGYNSSGNAVFMLQIENFTVRNRVAGLCDPTALDQEIVTRTQAEHLIQAAVSASAATKQDKLSSANAGTGISISSNGTISTANIPQSSVAGLSASLAAKQDNISAGDLIELNGTTVNRRRYMSIIPENQIITRTVSIDGVTANALVLEPGNAYRISAISAQKWLATTAAFKGSSDTWGLESHIELFVAGTGFVHADSNVVLANALEPDAVNNCTVRFHDGKAIISVEDHIAGYVVTVGSGTTAGTLPYALHDVSDQYISFDASLNGQTLDLAGATTYAGEKHVVGNGYAETVLSGGIVCTSKTTFSNLSMDGVVASGGTMTLGDVNIPNGATVAVSGGGLAIEKVTGAGESSVIDLGGISILQNSNLEAKDVTFANGKLIRVQSSNTKALLSGCMISGFDNNDGTGGVQAYLGAGMDLRSCRIVSNHGNNAAVYNGANNRAYISGCLVSGNITSRSNTRPGAGVYNGYVMDIVDTEICNNSNGYGAGVCCVGGEGTVNMVSCYIHDNTDGSGAIYNGGMTMSITGSTIAAGQRINLVTSNAKLNIVDSNYIGQTVYGSGSVTLTSGAILDLTGNPNATPIAPGGGITFAPGGATVYPSAGSASAVTFGGGVMTAIQRDGAIVCKGGTGVFASGGWGWSGNATVLVSSAITHSSFSMTGLTISRVGDTTAQTNGFLFNGNGYTLSGCTFPNAATHRGIYITSGGVETVVKDCSFTYAQNADWGAGLFLANGASATLAGTTILKNRIAGNANSLLHIEEGATINLSGCLTTLAIAPASIVVADGGCTVINSAGATASVAGCRFGTIANNGTFGATGNITLTGGTYTNATFQPGSNYNYTPVNGSTVTLDNCTLKKGISYEVALSSGANELVIATNCALACSIWGRSNQVGAVLRILDGVTVTIDGQSYYNSPVNMVATVIIGSGVKFKYGTTVVDIAAGTYSNCSIDYQGNINVDGGCLIGDTHLTATISGSGTVTISSEAVLDLSGNTNAVPIAPGGGIILYGGHHDDIPTRIINGEDELNFVDLEIHGTSITNQGFIYGATVYFPETHSGYDVQYTPDGTTISSAVITGGTPAYVVSGGLVGVIQHYEDD